MNTSVNNTTTVYNQKSTPLSSKIAVACILGIMSLALASWAGEFSGLEGQARFGLQAIIMSGLVVPGIWLMHTRLNKDTPINIGVGTLSQALSKLALGLGLLFLPLILTISLIILCGWGNVNFNADDSTISKLIVGIGIVFLFEALPEELVFRGYIYSNLNTQFKRWISALITILLFVLMPIMLVPIQKYILGMEINLGGSNTVTASYIITMFFFGAFVQYLRILTGSIWTGIGFHLSFVYINRIMGVNSTDLIQFTDFTNETPVQITFIAALALVFISLLAYPRLTKRKLGWSELQE